MFLLILALQIEMGPTEAMKPSSHIKVFNATAAQQPAVHEISTLILNQYKAWEKGDSDAYMSVFWKSPSLLYIIDSTIYFGWDQTKAKIERDYGDRRERGGLTLERLKTNIINEGLATTIEWWAMTFEKETLKGYSSSTWRKFSEGWKIIEIHTAIPPG
jgi:hypothetical protein